MLFFFVDLERDGRLENFLEQALEDRDFKSHLSYYLKWVEKALNKDNRGLVEEVIKRKRETYPQGPDTLPLELEKKYNHEQLKLIALNLGAWQLSYGCDGRCPWCGFDAVRGVRENIPYNQLDNFLSQYSQELSVTKPPEPYWASDLPDYTDEVANKTATDVLELFDKYVGLEKMHLTFRKILDKEGGGG